MKASTTICRLVLSFLSQFFQSRKCPYFRGSDEGKGSQPRESLVDCRNYKQTHFPGNQRWSLGSVPF